jgi:O-acetyl-ADP-ribose deacetylase (regulator of RNase III)
MLVGEKGTAGHLCEEQTMIVVHRQSVLEVVLVDLNPRVVQAWQGAFADFAEVRVRQSSILEQNVDAWVTPTNARGSMDGGVDAAIKDYLGSQIEQQVRREIGRLYGGALPVGCATCVATGADTPRFLISTPTMVRSSEDVSGTLNVALACAAAFQAIHQQNAREADSITSVALPGLGAATGRVPPRKCAELMRAAYTLTSDCVYRDFETMRAALVEQLGRMDAGARGSAGTMPAFVTGTTLDRTPLVRRPNRAFAW